VKEHKRPQAGMDFEQAERRFRDLRTQRDSGSLDDEAFRVEVAKLLFRDDWGVFWMPDADDGGWFQNRGEGWTPGDPRADHPAQPLWPEKRRLRRRSLARVLVVSVIVIVLVATAAFVVQQRWPRTLGNPLPQAAMENAVVQVTIASPADHSQVAVGQEVAVESTLRATRDLQAVDHVNLVVQGQTVHNLSVRGKIQPQQSSLPLSLPWLPASIGEFQVAVLALSAEGQLLGESTITLNAVEAPSQALPEPACTPDATFVTDVTIPPGTAFPPGARMDKVWQVRNNGSCAWGVGYGLVLVEGEALGAPGAVPVPATAAGDAADLTVNFWAPAEAGSYVSVWRLQSPNGELFGPALLLEIQVEALASKSQPPAAPANLQATLIEDGKAVQLTWFDRSDDEDAFRIYRGDVQASVGLAPADAQVFVDRGIACGNTYRYSIVAFNSAGTSPISEIAEVSSPACAPPDAAPSLLLTVAPTHVVATEPFTITFEANDDVGLTLVTLQGEETGVPVLDAGRVFTCTGMTCLGSWPVTVPLSVTVDVEPSTDGEEVTREISATLAFVAMALDSSGQASKPAWLMVAILPPE
jgi:hypothetical protein